GAGWLYSLFDAIIAQRAFTCGMCAMVVASNYAEGAGHHAVAAAVADILLHVDRVELGANNRACWAGLVAGCMDAVLAHVAAHQPAVSIKKGERGSGRQLWNKAVAPGLRYLAKQRQGRRQRRSWRDV